MAVPSITARTTRSQVRIPVDDLTPARGALRSVLLGGALWLVVIALWYAAVRS
jgi:hypothetical protein